MKKFAKLKVGSHVWMDFQGHKWPEIRHGDKNIVFEVTPEKEGWSFLRAENFGIKGKYGSGGILVQNKDLVYCESEDKEVEYCLFVLKQIVDALPSKCDWLDPDIEKNARLLISE